MANFKQYSRAKAVDSAFLMVKQEMTVANLAVDLPAKTPVRFSDKFCSALSF
jgi:hypothetical protein